MQLPESSWKFQMKLSSECCDTFELFLSTAAFRTLSLSHDETAKITEVSLASNSDKFCSPAKLFAQTVWTSDDSKKYLSLTWIPKFFWLEKLKVSRFLQFVSISIQVLLHRNKYSNSSKHHLNSPHWSYASRRFLGFKLVSSNSLKFPWFLLVRCESRKDFSKRVFRFLSIRFNLHIFPREIFTV